MAIPGQASGIISDLVPEVVHALQDRTDVAPLAPLYIKRAIQELTESYPFSELERTGPLVQLTQNVSTYPATMFMNTGEDYTFPNSFAIYVDYPTNTVVGTIDYKTPKAIEQMISPATMGIPSKFTRYGVNFMLGPTPDQPYSVFLRYQQRHPFPSDNSSSAIASAEIFMPDEWQEIIVYSAAMRIAIIKRWNDQAKLMHDILFGDPEYQVSEGKRGNPGLITSRTAQITRDQMFNTRQVMPMVGRYGPR